ncbi:MAG: hypothetical protein IKM23_03350 [Bacteroidales bacterium]|nr:hypothetical protein [Bacteroidales bacterium]
MATQESTALVKQENIQAIVSSAPKAYEIGKMSHDKCLEFGNALLKKIEENGGMNDQLDSEVADYLVRVGTTLKKINDTRTPVTRLFDDIKKVFTTLENDIDKTKTGSLPFRLQALRNAYAKQKFEEAEKKRKEEEARQRAIAVKNQYIQDVKNDYRRLISEAISNSCKTLMDLDNNVTLENYQKTYDFVDDFQIELPLEWYKELKHTIGIPNIPISIDELRQIEIDVKNELYKEFSEQYLYEIESTKVYVLERLPSKKINLEKMAKANVEEAERMRQAMEVNKAKEAERMEAERKQREQEQQRKAEATQQMNEMNNLFAMAEAAQPVAKTSVKVSKKIEILNVNGILPIIHMWFSQEGCNLGTDELAKIFKKQITFCEKLANSKDEFIDDKNIKYVDDVKAK